MKLIAILQKGEISHIGGFVVKTVLHRIWVHLNFPLICKFELAFTLLYSTS